MESEQDPFVRNPGRAFRNSFFGLLFLGLLAGPVLYFSEDFEITDWHPIAFVSLVGAIAITYALFLSFVAVGCSLLFDRRRSGRMMLFYCALGGVPAILISSLLLFVRFSRPDQLADHIGYFAQLFMWMVLGFLLAVFGAACVGWRKHGRSIEG